ncbi:hypothetical protein [Aeoliella sp. SH292]|uniref:hypothetical protein n=1 Tax=Aeoliella sp. SH292 TaxID=3454464 RepID=UPI003F963B8E
MMFCGWNNGSALAVLLVALASGVALADSDPMAATGGRAAREEAMRSIPWSQLDAGEQRMVQYITRNATMYRRMPTRVIDCDPQVFNFLGQNPEVVTELWKLMGVCNLNLEKVGPNTYKASDDAGTKGTMTFLAANWNDDAQNTVLVYCEGTYNGAPLPAEVSARSVLLLRSGSMVETSGRPYITARLDSFVLVDRLGAEMVAKTIQPLIVKTADHNFTETMKFVSTFSQTAEKNPSGMQRLSARLEKVEEPTRMNMAQVCAAAAARYQAIGLAHQDSKVQLATRNEEPVR